MKGSIYRKGATLGQVTLFSHGGKLVRFKCRGTAKAKGRLKVKLSAKTMEAKKIGKQKVRREGRKFPGEPTRLLIIVLHADAWQHIRFRQTGWEKPKTNGSKHAHGKLGRKREGEKPSKT